MAERNLNIKITAQDATSSALRKAESAVASLGTRVKTTAENMVNLKTVSVAATAAIVAVTYGIYKFTQAAAEAEAAEKKLTTALGFRSQALIDQSSALQKVTEFGDDQIQQAQASIAAFTKNESHVRALTAATLDLASAKSMDLTSAAELVARSFGTSTNALARQGIAVDGVAHSTERLRQITEGIAVLYGGQAAAAGETYAGRITQIKNAYGDLHEELGFVITRNTFFTQGLDVLRQYLERAAQWINNNQLALMNMAKNGIVTVISAVGKAVEVMRFFHNGWLGLKLVANVTIIGMAESLKFLFGAIERLLIPFKALIDGWIWLNKLMGLDEFGAMTINPLEAAINSGRAALENFQLSSRDVLAETIKDVETINSRYDKWGGTVRAIVSKLRDIKVEQEEIRNNAPGSGGIGGVIGNARTGVSGGKAGEQADSHVDAFTAAQLMPNFLQDRLAQQQAYYSVLVEMGKKFTDEEIKQAMKRGDVQQYVAEQSFSVLSNTMQNLTVLTGKEGGVAFKAMKAFAIAETTIQTYRAAMASYAALAPIPIIGPALGVAAAAAATVAGLARVKQIQSMEPGGSATGTTIGAGGTATPSYSGGSTDAYPVPTRTEAQAPMNITLIVNTLDGADVNWDRIIEKNLTPALERYSGEGNRPMNIRVEQR